MILFLFFKQFYLKWIGYSFYSLTLQNYKKKIIFAKKFRYEKKLEKK
jgi:hypothetical protein